MKDLRTHIFEAVSHGRNSRNLLPPAKLNRSGVVDWLSDNITSTIDKGIVKKKDIDEKGKLFWSGWSKYYGCPEVTVWLRDYNDDYYTFSIVFTKTGDAIRMMYVYKDNELIMDDNHIMPKMEFLAKCLS
jgi:hypothetical protein